MSSKPDKEKYNNPSGGQQNPGQSGQHGQQGQQQGQTGQQGQSQKDDQFNKDQGGQKNSQR